MITFEKLYPAFIITRREVRDQMRDWRIVIPVIALALISPLLMNFTAKQVMNFVQTYGARLVGDRLIPFLLMAVGFFPISVSLVIALESFVGEQERRSIEPLLSSPLTNWQLYLGKLLASLAPPLIGSYLAIFVYLVGVYRQLHWIADPAFLLQILLLTTVQALVMVSGAVVISTQTTSVRAANLLASFIIIPMMLLIQGESIIMFWAHYSVLWWIIFAQVLIAGLLIRTGIAHFNREELLGQELDMLNFKWGWNVFKQAFTGPDSIGRASSDAGVLGRLNSLGHWYRREVGQAMRKLTLPLIFMALALAAGLGIGANLANAFIIPPELLKLDNLKNGSIEGFEVLPLYLAGGVLLVWLHNLRALILATTLGIFSFGVLSVIILALPLAILGFFMASLARAGLAPVLFMMAFVLPHGILEIPAIIIAGAAILRLGATLATPAYHQTIGEAWLQALADWAKVMVGVALPLFFGAASLEVFVTPAIVIRLLSTLNS